MVDDIKQGQQVLSAVERTATTQPSTGLSSLLRQARLPFRGARKQARAGAAKETVLLSSTNTGHIPLKGQWSMSACMDQLSGANQGGWHTCHRHASAQVPSQRKLRRAGAGCMPAPRLQDSKKCKKPRKPRADETQTKKRADHLEPTACQQTSSAACKRGIFCCCHLPLCL